MTEMILPVASAVLLLGVSIPAASDRLILSSPLDYQVVQRLTRTEGAVLIQAKTTCIAEKWQYRLTGKPLDAKEDEAWLESQIALELQGGHVERKPGPVVTDAPSG